MIRYIQRNTCKKDNRFLVENNVGGKIVTKHLKSAKRKHINKQISVNLELCT